MPATPVALAIAISLVPGYLYLQLSAKFRDPTKKSSVAEALEVASIGLGTTGLAIIALALATPGRLHAAVVALETDPVELSRSDTRLLAEHSMILLVTALLLSLAAYGATRFISRRTFSPSTMQGTLGQMKPGSGPHVGITLVGGKTIDGLLHAYSMTDDESARVVALKAPLRMFDKTAGVKNLPFDFYIVFGPQIEGVSMSFAPDPLAKSTSQQSWLVPGLTLALAAALVVLLCIT